MNNEEKYLFVLSIFWLIVFFTWQIFLLFVYNFIQMATTKVPEVRDITRIERIGKNLYLMKLEIESSNDLNELSMECVYVLFQMWLMFSSFCLLFRGPFSYSWPWFGWCFGAKTGNIKAFIFHQSTIILWLLICHWVGPHANKAALINQVVNKEHLGVSRCAWHRDIG